MPRPNGSFLLNGRRRDFCRTLISDHVICKISCGRTRVKKERVRQTYICAWRSDQDCRMVLRWWMGIHLASLPDLYNRLNPLSASLVSGVIGGCRLLSLQKKMSAE